MRVCIRYCIVNVSGMLWLLQDRNGRLDLPCEGYVEQAFGTPMLDEVRHTWTAEPKNGDSTYVFCMIKCDTSPNHTQPGGFFSAHYLSNTDSYGQSNGHHLSEAASLFLRTHFSIERYVPLYVSQHGHILFESYAGRYRLRSFPRSEHNRDLRVVTQARASWGEFSSWVVNFYNPTESEREWASTVKYAWSWVAPEEIPNHVYVGGSPLLMHNLVVAWNVARTLKYLGERQVDRVQRPGVSVFDLL
jgi:hypothetical protein